MIRIRRDSSIAIIVVHEIYGLNEHMRTVCQNLSDHGYDVFCPDLLGREIPFDYSQEEEAYAFFMERVGFTHALEQINQLLSSIEHEYRKIVVVGFSIGATVAWLCSTEQRIDGVIGFYGSRIRNYRDREPRCPALLFFPQEEKSFNVDELIMALSRKSNVDVHQFAGQHGFADSYSPQYNKASADEAWGQMLKFLERINGIHNWRDRE